MFPFRSSEPTIGNSNLTQSDLDRLLDLDDTYRTDYTYVTSKSYRSDGSDDYENPRMSRLPLSYYRRKWAFERARKVLWYLINVIFPNPKGFSIDSRRGRSQQTQMTPYQQQRLMQYNDSFENSQKWRDQREFRPSPTPGRIATVWRVQAVPSTSFISRLGQLLTSLVTLGYYSSKDQLQTPKRRRGFDGNADEDDFHDEQQWKGRSSFVPQRDSTRNVRRRVRTSSYEYSEDREPEFAYQSSATHTVEAPKRFIESIVYKLFYLIFMSLLLPIKGFEFSVEKIAHFFGYSIPTYDLRTRTIYKNLPIQPPLPYTDRIVNFLSEVATWCVINIFSVAAKVLLLPVTVPSSIIGHMLNLFTTKQTPQQKVTGIATSVDTGPEIFRSIESILSTVFWGIISFFSFLQAVPFHIAEIIRERIAYALANIFGPKAAELVGFEEVRAVTKRVISDEPGVPVGIARRRKVIMYDKSQLISTQRSVRYCSAFWKWLFPLLLLAFLIGIFSEGRVDRDGSLIMKTAVLPFRILKNLLTGLVAATVNTLNFVFRVFGDILSTPFRLLRTLLDSSGILNGTWKYPRETVERMIELPKYVYMTGHSVIKKAIGPVANSLFGIPHVIYNSGKSLATYFLDAFHLLRAAVYRIIGQISVIPEWVLSSSVFKEFYESGKYYLNGLLNIPKFFYQLAGRIIGSIFGLLCSVSGLIYDLGQLLLALPSYLISRTVELIPSVQHRETDDVKWSASPDYSNDGLNRLRREKEHLEAEMAELRRERELEEKRYKDIHEAIRLVGDKSQSSSALPVTDERLSKSIVVNEELLQHKIEKDFQNYVANLKKSEDAELATRLLGIEKRLVERLNTLSRNIENEIAQKITHTSEKAGMGHLALSNELSELSSAVVNLRVEFDKLRREKEAKIAEFAHAIMLRDSKQGDNLNLLKTELNNKIKDDLEKGLSSSLSRFEKASQEEREAFRLEIMKMVENRIVTLFASHLAERGISGSKTKVQSIPGLSESDFMIIKKMITDALDTYDADKTGKVDYALESSGASVVSTRCTEPYKENSRLESVFGIPLWYSSYSPRAVIQHRPLAAGECWAFRGKGYLTIKLSHPIYITEVSYEHLHSTLHPEGILRSAPKIFQVYSYKAVDDISSKFLLGEFEYDITGRALQTFRVQNKPATPVSIIELVILSNWESDYTCLYRFRVHGQKAQNAQIN